MSTLALLGGTPVRTEKFPGYRVMGQEEKDATARVIDSGVLSGFIAGWHENFWGGPEVRALEEEWAAHFRVKHAIAVNSATSGLMAAVGAVGVEPGDEVIVPPYTMSATAVAPLVWNAVPVFADLEPRGFCLDPVSVEARITPRTRAILAVDIFGHPYDAEALNALARKYGLAVIEDCAQAPGASYQGRFAGTLGNLGIFSLNFHKHIHCGEGGVVVTDDDDLALRVRMIRNHAESSLDNSGITDLRNMVGFNFRMTELEAAVARCQLRKLDHVLPERQENCAYLNARLGEIPAISPTWVREGATHSYYFHALTFDEGVAGVSRNRFIDAVRAELPVTELREKEGVNLRAGYVKPVYLLPMFQERQAYGSRHCPFVAPWHEGNVSYAPGICPVCERLQSSEIFVHELMRPPFRREDLDDVVRAFEKVWEHRKDLA
ncbi:MAG TPA: DegT/DnrJ/EryC1/StrS family aminotransferase [Synergistaceae bacterium]|nr:DegT/DnrJ/EryC1/StrS family aminotransferase [Synergistaceae bacterium]